LRALGVDFGEKRIGLALSDPTGTIATPLDTLVRRAGKRVPFAKMEAIGRDNDVVHLVVGLPLGLDGQENEWCARIREMGGTLAERLGVEVAFVDERMTSVRAERAVRSIGLKKTAREDKRRIDAAAAQLILQSWLDRQAVAR
jgi:putative pre-16S rRNA nuclease